MYLIMRVATQIQKVSCEAIVIIPAASDDYNIMYVFRLPFYRTTAYQTYIGNICIILIVTIRYVLRAEVNDVAAIINI